MWKKLGVTLIALLSTFSVVYAMNQDMFASVPSLDIDTLSEGDKIYLGEDASGETVWDVSVAKADSYVLATTSLKGAFQTCNANTDNITAGTLSDPANYKVYSCKFITSTAGKVNSSLYNAISNYNATFKNKLSPIEKNLLINQSAKSPGGFDYAFIPSNMQITKGGELGVTVSKQIALAQYYVAGTSFNANNSYKEFNNVIIGSDDNAPTNGNLQLKGSTSSAEKYSPWLFRSYGYRNSAYENVNLRPFSIINRSGINLLLDSDVTGATLEAISYKKTSQGDGNIDGALKMRVNDSTYTISFIDIKNDKDDSILATSVVKDKTIKLRGDASSGTNHTVSVLVFDELENNLLYYKTLASANGLDNYNFDTTGLPVGKYKLALINEEVDLSTKRPASSSPISSKLSIEIVEPHTIAYTSKPQSQNIYEYDKNVDERSKIGELTRSDGAVPIHYEIVSASVGDNTYQNFEIAGLNVDGNSSAAILDVKVKNSGAPDIVNTTNSLKTGIYKFCIESTDKNGDPVTQVDEQSKVCTSFVVYPGDSQLVNKQLKNTSTSVLYTKDELNTIAIGSKLGTLTFSDGTLLDGSGVAIDDANIDVLNGEGYNIEEIRLVKPGTTTPLTELEAKAIVGDLNQFEIKKKSGASFSSNINFDALVVFEHGGSEVAIIRKSNQVFEVPSGIKFVNPDEAKFLSENTYRYTWNPDTSSSNQFVLMATDKTTATMTNSSMEYCILNEAKECVDSSSVLSFISGGSSGTQKLQVKAPGTTDQKVKIRAKLKDADGNLYMYSDIEIIIHPASQKLSWEGTNIQEKDNHISKDSAKHNTWNLNLKYDKDTAANNVHASSEIIKEVPLVDKIITLRDEVVSGVTPAITYEITYSDSSDNGKVSIASNKLTITGELKGDVTIIASAAAVDNYHESKLDDTTTTGVNEDERATLILSVSSKAKVVFTPSYGSSFDTTSNYANGTAGLGMITLDPTTETGYTYEIESVKQLNTTTGDYDTIDSSKFLIKKEGNPAKDILYAKSGSTLSAGTYIVKVKATKGSESATPKEITIVVSAASMDASKIKWTQKDKISDTYGDVDGEIDKDTKTNTEILSKKYQNIDGVEGTFYVNVANKGDTLLTGSTIKYALSLDSTTGIIEVAEDGKVTMKNASKSDSSLFINATISKDGYDDIVVKLPIKIEKGEITDFKFAKKSGTAYELDGDKKDITKYATQTFTYAQGDAGLLDIFTKGAPTGNDVTIKITSNGATKGNDVLKFNGSDASKNADSDNPKVCVISKDDYTANRTKKCQAMIENALANQTSDKGKIVLSASIDESDNYNAITLTMKINISQASNSDFGYVQDELYVESNTNGAIQPIFQDKDDTHPNIGTGKTMLLLDKVGETPSFTTGEVELNPTEYNPDNKPDNPYFNGYKSYVYDITVDKDASANRTIYLYAQKLADRNHEASDVKTLTVHIMPEGQSQVVTTVISYPPGNTTGVNKITYGDIYFKLKTVSPDDESDPAATYTYELDDNAKKYMESYGSNTNEFKPLKAGENIKVKITRTSSTGATTTSTAILTIHPKPIKLKIEDISKKAGMSVDSSEYKFTTDSEDFLTVDKDKIKLAFSCLYADGKDVSTLSDGVRIAHNALTITVLIEDKNALDDVLSNYKILNSDGKTLGVENGKLTVSEVESDASWYEVKEGSKLDPITSTPIPTIKGQNDWYNGPVDVILKTVTGSYDQIAPEDKASAWKNDKFEVTTEGNNVQEVYFRMSSGTDKGSITKPQEEAIKIDTVSPEVKEIKATLTHTDAFSKLIHAITFGTFMKPGEEVTINTKDVQNNPSIEVSTTNSITDALTYDVYTLDINGVRDTQIVTKEKLDTNKEGVATFTLDEPGVYEVCAIVQDQATNVSLEKCEKLLVKKIGVDGDGDDIPDYLDPDEDGCPDLDIVLTDKKGDLYKINVDRDKDNIPDLNIDSDGDGTAEINVDTDKDGKPDLNLVILKEWKPTFCVSNQSEEYCTMKDIEGLINVDTGNDDIPDINIDVTGDMKADLNITKEGSEVPYSNITTIKTWKPEVNYIWDEFPYDTDNVHKPHLNIDTDGNGRPDMNLDTNNDGVADINIDVNGDGEPEINIDTDGDGEADFNIDIGDDGIADENIIVLPKWKPDTAIKDSDFDTMGGLKANDTLIDGDSGIQIQKPGGSFLPNYSIKVDNIKDSIDAKDKGKIEEYIDDDTEIKDIYDVELSDGTSAIQPDGSIKVRIPVSEDLANSGTVKVIVEQADGSYKEVSATIKDGFIEYETDYLGKVGIIADKAKVEEPDPTPDPDPVKPDVPIPDFKPNGSGGSTPDTSVKGNYTLGVGGAGTGDTTNIMIYVLLCGCSILSMRYVLQKEKKQ